MSLLITKQHKTNPFEERKQLFFKFIQKNGIMKRSVLIGVMCVTVDMFQREYKSYLEIFNGIIKYNEKTQSFLYNTNDFIFDIDYWNSYDLVQTAEHVSQHQQQTIVS